MPNSAAISVQITLFSTNEVFGNFNLSRELMQKHIAVPKQFIVISNAESPNFENILKPQVIGIPQILYIKNSKLKKRSTAGDMMYDIEVKADLKAYL